MQVIHVLNKEVDQHLGRWQPLTWDEVGLLREEVYDGPAAPQQSPSLCPPMVRLGLLPTVTNLLAFLFSAL